MILITKEEARAIREKYGNEVCIATTNRKKKSRRKQHYVEETSRVMYFLGRLAKKNQKKAGAGAPRGGARYD